MGFFDAFCQLSRRNFINILLPRRIYFSENQNIGFVEGAGKLVKQRHRPRVGVRLEKTPQPVVRDILAGRQGGPDLRRMVRIIVDDLDARAGDAHNVEAPLRAVVALQRVADHLRRNAQAVAAGEGCQRIEDVVLAGNGKLNIRKLLALMLYRKRRHPVLVKDYIRRPVGAVFSQAESYHVAAVLDHLVDERVGVISDDQPARRHQRGKPVKRIDDVVDVLEIVKMV